MISQLTIELPANLAQRLAGLAAAQQKSLAEVAIERLTSALEAETEPLRGSTAAILQAMREPPHLTNADVDELEQAIAASQLPISAVGIFDEETQP